MALLVNGLAILGAILLCAALVPVRSLIALSPSASVRRNWYILTALTLLFMFGCVGYAVVRWNNPIGFSDLMASAALFVGALLIWLVDNLSLQTARQVKRATVLEQDSITNPALGIYDRRYSERRLTEEVARAHRYGLPLSVLLLDIDHFQQINDAYGHHAGDLTLTSLGRLIVNTARKTDIVARHGGDEILVIAPNTSISSATTLAERLQQVVTSSPVPPQSESNDEPTVSLKVSIGVSILGAGISDAYTLLDSAGAALRLAKKQGGNRVIVNEFSVSP